MAEGRIVAHGTHNRRLYDLHEVAQVMEHLGRRHRKDTA
jgi:hypothetical protein